MGCFKITWNLLNLLYSIAAVVIAFESQHITIAVVSLCLFSVHIFFTLTVNGLARKNLNESIHSHECSLLLQNCIVLLLTALLIIFAADSHLILFTLPFILYISLLHIVCLCVACLSQDGYRFLQVCCKRRCHHSCECNVDSSSNCIRKCAKLEDCLTMTISCTYCCKPRFKKKVKRRSVSLKEELRKNLPKTSKSSLNFSKPSEMSVASKGHYKESSDIIEVLKPKKKSGKESYVQTKEGVRLSPQSQKKKKAQNTAKVKPFQEVQSSFSSLPLKDEAGSIRSLNLMVPDQLSSSYDHSAHGHIPEEEIGHLPECLICGEIIVKEEDGVAVPKCKHLFHAHCLRIHAREKGQRECAKCGAFYKALEPLSEAI